MEVAARLEFSTLTCEDPGQTDVHPYLLLIHVATHCITQMPGRRKRRAQKQRFLLQ